MSTPRIDQARLWDSIEAHGTIGATAEGGVCREALTEADRLGRDRFVEWCREAGMEVAVDRLGNIFATRAGSDNSLEPVAMGSHLDTQPTGGKYDGILGVLGGLEVVRALDDAGITTRRPITLVNWTNEEGSRFVPSMVASGVYAGVFSMEQVREIVDRDGIGLLDALERIGYSGDEKVGTRRFKAFIELHIEQGPVLESRDMEIGVVTGSQAMDWSRVTIAGRPSHAGTTPMPARLDPLQAATRMLDVLYRLGNSMNDARVTIGLIDAIPGSHSTIPQRVDFTLDLRHPRQARIDTLLACFETAARAERARGFSVEREVFGTAEAQAFDEDCVAVVREAAREAGYRHCDIISGAGHDAIYVARVCPSAMIFTPCLGGVSHNPQESITPGQAAAGADVLLRSVLKLANLD